MAASDLRAPDVDFELGGAGQPGRRLIPPDDARPPRGAAVRLRAHYAAYFALIGVYLPFWPLWLADRGLSAEQIGWALSAAMLSRIVGNPLIGALSDRLGDPRTVMLGLALSSLLIFSAFGFAFDFGAIVALCALAGLAHAAINPLAESLTLSLSERHGLDYGRIRVWGSIAFILATWGLGALLDSAAPWLILAALIALQVLDCLACLVLPRARPGTGARPRPRFAGIARLLRWPVFWLFVGAATALQASHAVLYGFASLHWRDAGISSGWIGALWAEGVIAEIAIFIWGGRLLARLGVVGLLLAAAAAALLRWSLLAASTDLAWLLAAQALHGLTFGAAHLASMHFIAAAAPRELAATAQSLYAAIGTGLVGGLAMAAAGRLYGSWAGDAFLAMTALAALAALLSLALGRCWHGERLAD